MPKRDLVARDRIFKHLSESFHGASLTGCISAVVLSYKRSGPEGIAIVMMPFLGGSQAEYSEVVQGLSGTHACVTIDLPGFGDSASVSGYSVAEMASGVIDVLRHLNAEAFVLAGHSMAGKVSMAVARQLINEPGHLPPPRGLILLAPSPPSPEPIDDEKRADMLQSLGAQNHCNPTERRSQAERYINDNIAAPLPENVFRRTVDELLRMNPEAWSAWLEAGSREDWSDRVGILDLPTLLLSGSRDQGLGPEVQRKLTLPHFSAAEEVVLACGHLLPLELPQEVTRHISRFVGGLV